MEWFKRYPHLECLCFHCVCVYVCADVNLCVRVRCPLLQRKGFCEKHKAGGGYGHGEKTEHQAPLFSALGFYH